MAIKPLRKTVIASAKDVTYPVYCAVLDQMQGREVAFDFSFPTALVKAFGDLKEMFNDIAKEFKVGIGEIVKAFKHKDVFALLKGLGFNIKAIWKGILAFTGLVPKGLFKVFDAIAKSGALDRLKAGTMKIDELIHKYPLLTRLAGIALGGLLIWIWMSCAFTGNPDFDFNIATIIAAFKGDFDLTDLFLSPSGLAMLTALGVGMFTGLGVSWLGSNIGNLLLALVYTGARKLHDSGLVSKMTKHLQPHKY